MSSLWFVSNCCFTFSISNDTHKESDHNSKHDSFLALPLLVFNRLGSFCNNRALLLPSTHRCQSLWTFLSIPLMVCARWSTPPYLCSLSFQKRFSQFILSIFFLVIPPTPLMIRGRWPHLWVSSPELTFTYSLPLSPVLNWIWFRQCSQKSISDTISCHLQWFWHITLILINPILLLLIIIIITLTYSFWIEALRPGHNNQQQLHAYHPHRHHHH